MKLGTLQDAITYFANPKHCREYLTANRWPEGVECPRCGSKNVLFLEKYNRWHCREKHDAPQFTLKTGTVMEDSPIGFEKWLPAFWLLANCRNGISSYELHRALGVTQKTAWFMLHRIRLAMKAEGHGPMGGEGHNIEADESWVGGDAKNKHHTKAQRAPRFVKTAWGTVVQNPAHHLNAKERKTDKVPVMGLLNRNTREIRAKVVPNVRRDVLMNEILANVTKGSRILTDEHKGYDALGKNGFVRESVNHLNEYVRGDVHTNGLENFWSLLKRGLKGTYVAVEPFHLDRYVDEQVFRYNHRKDAKGIPNSDADRFSLAVGQVAGKRLTYAELTGKVGETSESF